MNPVPTAEQAKHMKKAGISYPFLWTVIQDDSDGMILVHCISKEIRYIRKGAADGEDIGFTVPGVL